MSIKDKASEFAHEVKDTVVPGGKSQKQEAQEQQEVEQEQEDQEADVKTPATAVLEAAQPFEVEGGEGRVHQMQARHARLAMQEAVLDAKRHLANAADVRPALRRYPYVAVGGSLAVGFVAAAILVPSKKQRAAQRLRALERAVRAESAAGGKPVGKPSTTRTRKAAGLAWRYAQPALLSLVTGAISGAAGGAAQADDDNAAPAAETADAT